MDERGTTDLRETVLHLVQVAEDPQFMTPRVIGDDPHATGPEGVVDVLDISLDLLVGLLQQLHLFLLFVVRLHHLGDVTAGCHHTMEFAVFVANRTEDRFVVESAAEFHVGDTLVFPFHLVDVGDG